MKTYISMASVGHEGVYKFCTDTTAYPDHTIYIKTCLKLPLKGRHKTMVSRLTIA